MKEKLVLHILMSQYSVDSRVRNETTKLVEKGIDVVVFCLNGKLYQGDEVREKVKIFRFGVSSIKALSYLTAYFMMFFSILRSHIRCVHAHDLTALPIGFLIAKFKGVPLIYDTHELWSHALHNNLPGFIEKSAIWIEKKLAKRADYVFTVSDSIAHYLENEFDQKKVYVLRNVPSYTHKKDYDLFRSKLGISKEEKIILYQGLISEGRGVHYLVDAAILLGDKYNFKFILMGYGPLVDEIKRKINSAQLDKKILILPAVDQSELLMYTSSADIGVHAISNLCLNHDFCLPNKLFEYVSGGLAVVVTNLTELSKFVNEYEIGKTFEDENAEDLALKIGSILENPEELKRMKSNSNKLRKMLTWENESETLITIYKKVFQEC